MEEILGGMIIGSVLTILAGKLIRGVGAGLRPVGKLLVKGTYVTVHGARTVADGATAGVKELWAEAKGHAAAAGNGSAEPEAAEAAAPAEAEPASEKRKHGGRPRRGAAED